MFKFDEGQTVALREDWPGLGLKAGDTGTIWVMYAMTPPAYEVTFRDQDGLDFDLTVDEPELMALPVREPIVRQPSKSQEKVLLHA